MTPNEEAALAELEERLQEKCTYRAIAKRLDVSRETVRNIEKRALSKLRKLVREGWKP